LRAARTSPGNGVFGRNSELALRYLALRLARPILLAATLGVAIITLAASGYPLPAAALAIAVAPLLLWVVVRIRAIPRQSRRHLQRLVLTRPARDPRPRSAAATGRSAARIRGHKKDKSSNAGTRSTPSAAARTFGPPGSSSRFLSSPLPAQADRQHVKRAARHFGRAALRRAACGRRGDPSPSGGGPAHPACSSSNPQFRLLLPGQPDQAAHSRQTGWPPRLSASWLR
jgi:hypothetical protein